MVSRNPDKQRMQMAERLREAREYLGLSQEDAAVALGLSRPAITNIESGGRRVEAVELDLLAALYRQPVSYFLGGNEETSEAVSERVEFLARAVHGLSEKDIQEVARFASFLRGAPSKANPPSKRRK